MKRLFAMTMLASLIILLPALVFGQNATLGGTVFDDSGALIPGVTITAKNNATGVVTTAISNQAGAYNFPSLLPGGYTVSAEKIGFSDTNLHGCDASGRGSATFEFQSEGCRNSHQSGGQHVG